MEPVTDNIDFLRTKTKKALGKFLSKEQNILSLEKNVFDNINSEYYTLVIYELISDIKKGEKLNTILQNIKNKKIHWKHETYNNLILEEDEQNNFIIQPFEVYEGALTCKCGSNRVYSYQKQSRSADEPMSTYATCMACKNSWVYSG